MFATGTKHKVQTEIVCFFYTHLLLYFFHALKINTISTINGNERKQIYVGNVKIRIGIAHSQNLHFAKGYCHK